MRSSAGRLERGKGTAAWRGAIRVATFGLLIGGGCLTQHGTAYAADVAPTDPTTPVEEPIISVPPDPAPEPTPEPTPTPGDSQAGIITCSACMISCTALLKNPALCLTSLCLVPCGTPGIL